MKSLRTRFKPFQGLFIAAALFLLLFYIFLIINKKTDRSLLDISGENRRAMELKLSPADLQQLNNRENTQWITIRLIETDKKSYRIKIRPLRQAALDFQINIDETIYQLYELKGKRREAFRFFKQADQWKLPRSNPLQVHLKINGVPIGSYLLEETIYEQIRDEEGGYLIRLNTDTHHLRKLHYEVKNGLRETLDTWFNRKELAAYFVFVSYFHPETVPPFQRLVFRFDAGTGKYRPFLTLQCIFSILEEAGAVFRPPSGKDAAFHNGPDRDTVQKLLARTRTSPYAELTAAVLGHGKKEPGKTE